MVTTFRSKCRPLKEFAIFFVLVGSAITFSDAFTTPTSSGSRTLQGPSIRRLIRDTAPSSQGSTTRTTKVATKKSTKLQSILSPTLAVWGVGHLVGGMLGAPFSARATNNKTGWYSKIALPSWTPPSFVFVPVWVTLYTLMGIAAGQVMMAGTTAATTTSRQTLRLWRCHYGLNLIWPFLFFEAKRLRLGYIINCFQVANLGLVIIPMFYRTNPVSALLLLPYFGWSCFATILNRAICQLNPTSNGYNDAMLQSDIAQLQQQAAKYAGV